jgi:hypothetical protein
MIASLKDKLKAVKEEGRTKTKEFESLEAEFRKREAEAADAQSDFASQQRKIEGHLANRPDDIDFATPEEREEWEIKNRELHCELDQLRAARDLAVRLRERARFPVVQAFEVVKYYKQAVVNIKNQIEALSEVFVPWKMPFTNL